MNIGTRRAAVIGAFVGVVCVGAIVAAVILGDDLRGSAQREAADDGPVLAALVLPDAEGVLTVRQVELVERTGDTLRLTSVDPLAPATVPGTSASTLAETYAFGGGDGLTSAYAATGLYPVAGWIVVGPDGWLRLSEGRPISVPLERDVEVFDGESLYSFPETGASVPPGQIAKLMDGVAFLTDAERKRVREYLGTVLVAGLVRGYRIHDEDIETNLDAEQLDRVFAEVKSAPVRADREP